MPSTRSAARWMRVSEKKRMLNRPVRTAAKTQVAKTLSLIQSREFDLAREAAREAASALDRAAQKGVIHSNNAARRKARLMRKLNQALASASSE